MPTTLDVTTIDRLARIARQVRAASIALVGICHENDLDYDQAVFPVEEILLDARDEIRAILKEAEDDDILRRLEARA